MKADEITIQFFKMKFMLRVNEECSISHERCRNMLVIGGPGAFIRTWDYPELQQQDIDSMRVHHLFAW